MTQEEIEAQDPAIVAIYDLLTAPGASPRIASTIGTRMYPVQVPDDTEAPYLTYSQLNAVPTGSKDATIVNEWNFDIEIFTKTGYEGKLVANAVRASLSEKVTEVEGIGNVRLLYSDELDGGFDETRELFITGLFFRARKA